MTKYKFKTYTKKYCMFLMNKICKENNIKLTFLKKNEGSTGYNYGSASINEIMLAPFTGKGHLEKMLISFFHEFAHLKLEKNIPGKVNGYCINHTSAMQYELWVTLLGINYAKENFKILFSDESVQWLLKQNFTYINDEVSESSRLLKSNKHFYTIKCYHISE